MCGGGGGGDKWVKVNFTTRITFLESFCCRLVRVLPFDKSFLPFGESCLPFDASWLPPDESLIATSRWAQATHCHHLTTNRLLPRLPRFSELVVSGFFLLLIFFIFFFLSSIDEVGLQGKQLEGVLPKADVSDLPLPPPPPPLPPPPPPPTAPGVDSS